MGLKPVGWSVKALPLCPRLGLTPSLSQSVVLPLERDDNGDLPWLSQDVYKQTESSQGMGEKGGAGD